MAEAGINVATTAIIHRRRVRRFDPRQSMRYTCRSGRRARRLAVGREDERSCSILYAAKPKTISAIKHVIISTLIAKPAIAKPFA